MQAYHQTSSKATGRHVVIGASVAYVAVALAFLARLPIIERAGELIPHSLVWLALSIVGPAALFSTGIEAWPVVAGLIALIASFIGLAGLARHKSLETEWWAFWLICAVVVCAGSG